MKKRVVTLSLIAACFLALPLEAKKKDQSAGFNSQAEEFSYALGIDMGRYLHQIKNTIPEEDLDMKELMRGMEEAMNASASMTEEKSRDILMNYFANVLPARKLEESEAWLATQKRKVKGIQESESGLLYVIKTPGDAEPRLRNANDRGTYTYVIKKINGEEMDRNDDGVEFSANAVIKGFAEGIQMIGPGGSIQMWVHPDLGYGSNGVGGAGGIGPNEALYIEVKCLNVIWNEDVEYDDEEEEYDVEYSEYDED